MDADVAAVSREEFLMLVETVRDNQRRLDASSTSALSVQMTEVIKDVGEVKSDLGKFKDEHLRAHRDEERTRQSTRRWAWGFAVAALTLVEGPLVLLLTHMRF